MLKKAALLGVITVSLVGCANKSVDDNKDTNVGQNKNTTTQEQNTSDLTKDVEYFSENTKELVGKNVNDLFNNLKEPNMVTYYVDSDDINMIDINTVDKRDIIEKGPVVKEFVYPSVKNPKNALYVYVNGEKITETKVGKLPGVDNTYYKDTDYKINYYYNYKNINSDDFDLKKDTAEFIGKTLDEFNKKYNLEHGNIELFKRGTEEKLSLYTLNNSDKGILVHSKDNIIKEIREVEKKLTKDTINEYLMK
jgi:hypothetical protein